MSGLALDSFLLPPSCAILEGRCGQYKVSKALYILSSVSSTSPCNSRSTRFFSSSARPAAINASALLNKSFRTSGGVCLSRPHNELLTLCAKPITFLFLFLSALHFFIRSSNAASSEDTVSKSSSSIFCRAASLLVESRTFFLSSPGAAPDGSVASAAVCSVDSENIS